MYCIWESPLSDTDSTSQLMKMDNSKVNSPGEAQLQHGTWLSPYTILTLVTIPL